MARSTLARTAILALLALGAPTAGHGQARSGAGSDCDVYVTCALRVKHSLFQSKIVRGPEDTVLAEIGFRTPDLEELLLRSPEAAASFSRFGREHRRESWLGLMGGVGFVGGIIAGASGSEDWAMGFSIGGTVFSMAAGIFHTRSREHLSRAIWMYNESLTETGRR